MIEPTVDIVRNSCCNQWSKDNGCSVILKKYKLESPLDFSAQRYQVPNGIDDESTEAQSRRLLVISYYWKVFQRFIWSGHGQLVFKLVKIQLVTDSVSLTQLNGGPKGLSQSVTSLGEAIWKPARENQFGLKFGLQILDCLSYFYLVESGISFS